VGSFFGADAAEQIVIFVKNSTEAINKAARRIPLSPDDVVLVSLMEHHSNDLPWRPQATVIHAAVTQQGELDLEDMRQKFAEHGKRIRLLAITGASNVTGAINPIHELAELAHSYGARILVDAAQLAPHRAIKIRPAGDPGHIDFLVASAHKMYAPFGAGVLIGPRDIFGRGAPDYSGGGTVEIVTEDDVYWTAPPDRDEAGVCVLGAVWRRPATCWMRSWTVWPRTRPTWRATRWRRGGRRAGIPGVIRSMLNITLPGGAVLSTEYAVGVRNGCFCAHPYVLRLLDIPDPVAWSWRKQVVSGVRAHLPGLVRVSYGCYNSQEEVDQLVRALRKIACGEIAGDYEQDQATGTFRERTFRPNLEEYFKL
jgi:selenocysteine lyase/cysteine desulfurase